MAESELVDDKALATRGVTALAEVPDWLQGAPEDDQVEGGNPKMPRLAIAQGMSPQVQNGPKKIKGLEIGQMFNTLTRTIYGNGPLEFAVVKRLPPRWIEFDADRKIVDPDVPPNDPRTQWRQTAEGRKPPIATQFLDFVVVLLADMEPIAISCSRSNMKSADELLGLIQIRRPKMIGGKPMRLPEFAMKFSVEAGQFPVPGQANSTYGAFVFKQAGDLVDEPEKARMVRQFREQFLQTPIDIDTELEPDASDSREVGDTSFDPNELERQARVDPGM